MVRSIIYTISAVLIIFSACKKKQENDADTSYNLVLPPGFPSPPIPDDNKLTNYRVALGKKLFFDNSLSRDYSISCASCHKQSNAFSDVSAFSKGVNDSLSVRNAPPLINLAYSNSFFWDGGVPTLELQVMGPIQNHKEMNMTLAEVIDRLKQQPDYVDLFNKAYNRDPDLYGLFRAIACYERILISGNSKFDKYLYQGQYDAMNSSEIRGMNIFFSDTTHCTTCHNGIHFTNRSFQNNGLAPVYADQGRYDITFDDSDKGKFKVPTLRNIELTAPYMHDGSIPSLDLVMQHYQNGGFSHPNKSPNVHGLALTNAQTQDLINFLKALTDEEFINNPEYKP